MTIIWCLGHRLFLDFPDSSQTQEGKGMYRCVSVWQRTDSSQCWREMLSPLQ